MSLAKHQYKDYKNLGQFFQNEKIFVFFGNKNCTKEILLQEFSDFTFVEVNQKHTDILHPTSTDLNHFSNERWFTYNTIADAISTTLSKVALVIKTADCLPILVHDLDFKTIYSIHAGWRGVENQITKKSLINCSSNLHAFIGPHIQQDQFEVDDDVYSELLNMIKNSKRHFSKSELLEIFQFKNKKYHINLSKIVINCSFEPFSTNIQMLISSIDTKLDLNFNSFRRDKNQSSRNYSFILIK